MSELTSIYKTKYMSEILLMRILLQEYNGFQFPPGPWQPELPLRPSYNEILRVTYLGRMREEGGERHDKLSLLERSKYIFNAGRVHLQGLGGSTWKYLSFLYSCYVILLCFESYVLYLHHFRIGINVLLKAFINYDNIFLVWYSVKSVDCLIWPAWWSPEGRREEGGDTTPPCLGLEPR